jgi:hypothetical protein
MVDVHTRMSGTNSDARLIGRHRNFIIVGLLRIHF